MAKVQRTYFVSPSLDAALENRAEREAENKATMLRRGLDAVVNEGIENLTVEERTGDMVLRSVWVDRDVVRKVEKLAKSKRCSKGAIYRMAIRWIVRGGATRTSMGVARTHGRGASANLSVAD